MRFRKKETLKQHSTTADVAVGEAALQLLARCHQPPETVEHERSFYSTQKAQWGTNTFPPSAICKLSATLLLRANHPVSSEESCSVNPPLPANIEQI
jgi:hypothetical protein